MVQNRRHKRDNRQIQEYFGIHAKKLLNFVYTFVATFWWWKILTDCFFPDIDW